MLWNRLPIFFKKIDDPGFAHTVVSEASPYESTERGLEDGNDVLESVL